MKKLQIEIGIYASLFFIANSVKKIRVLQGYFITLILEKFLPFRPLR
jgi:hypothetical protein